MLNRFASMHVAHRIHVIDCIVEKSANKNNLRWKCYVEEWADKPFYKKATAHFYCIKCRNAGMTFSKYVFKMGFQA